MMSGQRQEGLFARLRLETQAEHARVERLVPDVASQDASPDAYQVFLARMWGFHAPLEQHLFGLPGMDQVFEDLAVRAKTPLLEADLRALGLSPRLLPTCPLPGDVGEVRAGIGAFYVLEGATLGGQVILRELTRAIPETLSKAQGFLNCYGSRTGAMWKLFRRQADASLDAADHELVIGAARRTFDALSNWLECAVAVSAPAP